MKTEKEKGRIPERKTSDREGKENQKVMIPEIENLLLKVFYFLFCIKKFD